MRVLLLGFSGFSVVRKNPSELIVNDLGALKPRGVVIQKKILPVSFQRAKAQLKILLAQQNYDLVLGFGLEAKTAAPRFERIARNVICGVLPDRDGVSYPRKKKILPKGKATVSSNLSLHAIKSRLLKSKIEAEISEDAGTYVCNFVYYLMHAYARKSDKQVKVGFIHLPLHRQEANRLRLKCPAASLSNMKTSAKKIFREILKEI